ncbi:putative PIG3 family NAD(P)H quinone oxidoreductase [Pontibacter ummariensis]|uniref:Putative NAD(P)H quinone oxidoreductase, PIG3 family n=1 Tax=Pontibacter ummariensis TaxID=1610492 RepID=A0A239B496_9BACT|nr:NAD(P)H-quinone oxidoreductase [Pontibacter ummariensis]PRY16260.1 putative PIG3 family NAD(P)H quinone oxidoreductase [Pontibacter ummariensis]SNS02058.1 putative NAD(P)H quinone oxidoreductase, PIG3 family [Pontibacter ummariensis]
MKAILVKQPGGPEQLVLGEYEQPLPKPYELLVRVQATALNRADTLQRQGKYPPPKGASPLLGLEMAGEVVEAGISCSRFKKGDKVFGLLPGGGYAEYAVINESMAMPVPENLSMEEAAAIPEVFLTAFQALMWIGKLKPGERTLIHAGASGVGTAAIQLARAQRAEVLVTASGPKLQACLDLGANKAINYQEVNFEDEVLAYTNSEGVDVIVDFIAGPYFKKNVQCLRLDGRMVLLASLGGGNVSDLDLRSVLTKRLQITGSTLRSRTLGYQIELTEEMRAFAMPLFESGIIMPVIDTVFDWKQVAEAHRYMEENQNIGKIVLKVG